MPKISSFDFYIYAILKKYYFYKKKSLLKEIYVLFSKTNKK
jgi:hypothetical protein